MTKPKGLKNLPKEKEDTDKSPIKPVHQEPKPKVLIGYHPITGAEVWQ